MTVHKVTWANDQATSCTSGYGDQWFRNGTDVTITDANGSIVAVASLQHSRPQKNGSCVFTLHAANVDLKGPVFTVLVSGDAGVGVTFNRSRAHGFNVAFG